MLPPRVQIIAAILTMVGLMGCTQKYDYNVIIGIGLIYLGSKHGFLHNLVSFYVLIGLTIGVDIIQIITVKNQGVFMRFIVTIIQILCKIIIIALLKRTASQQNKLLSKQAQIRPNLQESKL